jgi:hypothetical protein
MGFNPAAVKTAVEEKGPGSQGTREPPQQGDARLSIPASEFFERFSRRPNAVICGSYRMGIPSLIRAYERLSAAGLAVLSPSGLGFVAEIDGLVLNNDEAGITPEAIERLRLDCIKAADLVWLHAPDGFVGLSGALEIGIANGAGVPVYAEEMPSDIALRSLVTTSSLDQAIAETITREKDDPGASRLPLQEDEPATAPEGGLQRKSAHEIARLITEEIGELARQNPGQRHRLAQPPKPAQPERDAD